MKSRYTPSNRTNSSSPRAHSRQYNINSNDVARPNVDNIDKQESEANAAISDLISNISILSARRDPLIKSVKSPKLLVRGLTELKDMVEMVDIKHSIVNQIKFLITNHARRLYSSTNTTQSSNSISHNPIQGSTGNSSSSITNNIHDSQFEGHMLHSVISGNPGTGKTTIGMILAKIWMALGFVNKSSSKDPSTSQSTNTSSVSLSSNQIATTFSNAIVHTVNESYRKRIRELEESQRNDHRKLDRLREMLTRCQTTSGEIRRKAIKLKPNSSKSLAISGDRDTSDKEWDSFLALTRSLRFGFDGAIREANIKEPISAGANEVSSGSNITIPSNTGSTGILSTSINTAQTEETDPYENMDPKFVVAAREDLIAEYLGQTAPKTKKVLESARGGVLFIDEAYSLCNMDGGSKDKYGEECLSTINEFMSLHPDEIIIIFAGYKDKLMSSIFKAQPGLMRRCAYFFEIKDYTIYGLIKIFKRQLAKNGWILAKNVKLEEILRPYTNLIHEGGGFTEKLAFFSKLMYGTAKFNETVRKDNTDVVLHDSIITESMIYDALNMLKESSMMDIDDEPPMGMYI